MISEKIRTLRASKGMTQEEFAEFCGISRPSIVRYETGANLPGRSAIEKIASACGVPASFLMDNEDNTSNDEDNNLFFSVLNAMTKEQKDQIMQYAKFILQGKK